MPCRTLSDSMKLLGVLAAFGTVMTTSAAPAVFQDKVLRLDEGVVVENGRATYYGDIRLEVGTDGSFQLREAHARQPAHIDTVSAALIQTFAPGPPTVHVIIAGYKSIPCVDLEPVGIAWEGKRLLLAVAETPPDPASICIAMVDPFEITVPLDVTGIPAGEYTVDVNGTTTTLNLP